MQTTFQNHDGYKECLSAVITNKDFHVKKMNLEGHRRLIVHLKKAWHILIVRNLVGFFALFNNFKYKN